MGDHLIVRSSADLTSNGKPLREAREEARERDVIGFELPASCGVKVKGRHRYFAVKDWLSRHEWLDRKAEASGFEVLTVNVTATQSKIEKRGKTIRIDQSDFCGILKVTDAGAFQHALENGVGGAARAFGRGMLII